jgi:hypothetical protein
MKYIYFFGNQPDEVYNLARDPLEKHDIADQMSREQLTNKRLQLLAWYSRVNSMYEKRDSEHE